jgi:leader peptidase (prepilin peptidase)/N-methyltransferase
MTPALTFWLLLMGPVVASFLTALSDRFCAGTPLLGPRSHCASCKTTVRALDLIPILSWPILRGRCRACGATIPARLWLAELAGLALVALAIWRGETGTEAILGAAFLLILLGLFQTDLTCMRLPDMLTLPLLVTGFGLGTLSRGVGPTFAAAVIGTLVLWLIGTAYQRIRGRAGLGLGDVKMMAGLSAAVGLIALPWVTLLAALSALGVALLQAARGDDVTWTRPVAFGCHLAVAGAVVWLAVN